MNRIYRIHHIQRLPQQWQQLPQHTAQKTPNHTNTKRANHTHHTNHKTIQIKNPPGHLNFVQVTPEHDHSVVVPHDDVTGVNIYPSDDHRHLRIEREGSIVHGRNEEKWIYFEVLGSASRGRTWLSRGRRWYRVVGGNKAENNTKKQERRSSVHQGIKEGTNQERKKNKRTEALGWDEGCLVSVRTMTESWMSP